MSYKLLSLLCYFKGGCFSKPQNFKILQVSVKESVLIVKNIYEKVSFRRNACNVISDMLKSNSITEVFLKAFSANI